MPTLIVTTREGEEKQLRASAGRSVMEVVREGGIDEMMALCGGCCSCATCHVYVEDSDNIPIPAMGADEDELLDSSDYRTEASRLSCQIPFCAELDGLRITIAPEG